jgi:hypothetical protein
VEKSSPSILPNFRKTTQSKQSSNWRKFAQSGHPGSVQQKMTWATYTDAKSISLLTFGLQPTWLKAKPILQESAWQTDRQIDRQTDSGAWSYDLSL